ncbi:MAG: methyltransferase domain-containing protein [Chromatiaceae bacterium]|nr:methyltransferase domain-containing protein [Chromatiaceae bacterium]
MDTLCAEPQSDALPPEHRPLERTSPRAMARMRFDLRWESDRARHTDTYVATKLNLWRDLFPPELEAQIMDRPVGHQVVHRFAPGELLPSWREKQLLRVRNNQFNRRFTRRGFVQPRVGRFYPRGIMEGLDGVFRTDLHPMRIVEVTRGELTADFNQPLADRELELRVRIEAIWAHGEEHGGRCNEIAELVSAGGPGMQARWRATPTDFWSDLPFLRADPRPDPEFYAGPRFVDHMDEAALAEVGALYGRLLPREGRVLDLMTSWHSHLPGHLDGVELTGLGLNAEELAANTRLSERLIQDLNQDPKLPFANASFAAVICTASVEYLTRPFEVFAEVARVLRPGGRFITTFTNRWFPPKAIQIWDGLHEFERPGLVSEYFLESGLFTGLETWSLRGLPRPEDDKYADRLAFSDPVYAVWGARV